MTLRRIAAILAASFTLSLNAWAQQVIASAASPGKVIDVEVQVDGSGKLGYAVKRHGKEVIGLSRLGFNLANAHKRSPRPPNTASPSTPTSRSRIPACAAPIRTG